MPKVRRPSGQRPLAPSHRFSSVTSASRRWKREGYNAWAVAELVDHARAGCLPLDRTYTASTARPTHDQTANTLDIQAPQTLSIAAITATHESTDSHSKACSTTGTALLTPISDDFHASDTDEEILDLGSADTNSPNMLFFPSWVHADPHDADDEHDAEVPTIPTCAFTSGPPTLPEEQAAVYDAVDLGTSALLHPRGSAREHTLSRADMHMYERLCPPPRSTPALNYSFTDAGEASRRESGCIDATGDILIGCSRTLLEAGRIPTPALAIHDVEPLAALDHEQPDINTCLRETEPWADLDDDFPAAHSLSDQWSPTISNDSPCDSLSSDVDDRTDSDKADTRSPSAGHETRSTSSRDQPAYRLASVGSVDASVRPRVPGAIMMALRVSHLLHIYYEVAFDALDGLSSRSYDSQTVQDVRGMQADLDLVLERLQETYQGYGDALIELRLEQDKVRDFMIKARELMGESSHEAHLGLSTQ